MNAKKKNLINLIEEDLSYLNEVELSKTYTYVLELLSGSMVNEIKQIDSGILIKKYLDTCQSNSAKSTRYTYCRVLNELLAAIKDNPNLEVIYTFIKNKHWGDNTISRNTVVIRRFLSWLFENRYLPQDYSKNIKIPQKVKKLAFCPTQNQVNLSLDSIGQTFKSDADVLKYSIIFKLYIKTGMRRNELLDLNVEDIDFGQKQIVVRKTKNKDVKIMPIDLDIEEILTNYLGYFKYINGPLFRGKQNKRLCRQVLMDVFYKIKKHADMPKEFKIHSLRHYFINTLRKNGVDFVTIQKLAGHRDIRTTEGYCNVGDEEKVKAIESIVV